MLCAVVFRQLEERPDNSSQEHRKCQSRRQISQHLCTKDIRPYGFNRVRESTLNLQLLLLINLKNTARQDYYNKKLGCILLNII